jgi:vacuolar-type H+-ATPase subunit F/Vma7
LEVVMVGDKYLATCFRLAGVRTIITDSDDETIRRLTELVIDEKIEVVIVAERVAMKMKSLREEQLRTGKLSPIFVIVPDFEGPLDERTKELRQLVNRAVGMKLKLGD